MKQDRSKAHKKAMKRTLLVTLLLLVPVGYLAYTRLAYQDLALLEPIAINEEFLIQAKGGAVFTRGHLLGKPTVLAIDLRQDPVSNHPNEELLEKTLDPLIKDPSPIRLLQYGKNPSSRWIPLELNQENEDQLKSMIKDLKMGQFYLVLLDESVKINAIIPLDDTAAMKRVERSLSKILFDHYLNRYLSQKTFFERGKL